MGNAGGLSRYRTADVHQPRRGCCSGAGVQAAIIAGEPIDAILVDVTPHSFGIAITDVFMGEMIPDQFKSSYPAEHHHPHQPRRKVLYDVP